MPSPRATPAPGRGRAAVPGPSPAGFSVVAAKRNLSFPNSLLFHGHLFAPRYMFFSEASETSRSSAALRGAGRARPVAPARCRRGLFGRTVLASSPCPPLAWDSRWPHGVECPWDIPPSPSPTAPEPLSGCARQPAATQRAGRRGDLGPGSVGNRQTEGYIWGRKRVCECDRSLQ